jgi:hypothetical protein
MPSFRPRLLLSFSIALSACDFFTLEDPENPQRPPSTAAGTGGTLTGVGGASGGVGGTTGGTGGVVAAGTGGSVAGTGGSVAGAGAGGAQAGSGGDTGLGGVAGIAGDGSGGAAPAGSSGTGTAGDGGSGTAGSGGSGGAASCSSLQGQSFNGHCYVFNSGAATWPNARAACESRSPGGHLVTITSQEEQTFVWGVATMQDAWIGATDGRGDMEPGDGTPSTWITGEDISQFNGWTDGEPNNYQKACPTGSGDCWEHCGFMQMSSSGAWNDDICGLTKPYVCEWDSGG